MFMSDELTASPTPVVHDVRHDIHSFYWVLLWVVLRHTRHTFSAPGEHLRYTALFGADLATADVDAEFGERKRE